MRHVSDLSDTRLNNRSIVEREVYMHTTRTISVLFYSAARFHFLQSANITWQTLGFSAWLTETLQELSFSGPTLHLNYLLRSGYSKAVFSVFIANGNQHNSGNCLNIHDSVTWNTESNYCLCLSTVVATDSLRIGLRS